MNRAYRIALFCGAVPLLLGVSVFLLWLVTDWVGLMFAGLLTLYGGLAMFLVGAVALAWYRWLARRATDVPPGRIRLRTLLCAGLLLVNFPVAGGIVAAVIGLETRYTVTVLNDSQRPLDGVRVSGGGCEVPFGTIEPGGVARRSFWIERDGELVFRATSGAATYEQTIDNYVTNNQGGTTIVTVDPEGKVSTSNDWND